MERYLACVISSLENCIGMLLKDQSAMAMALLRLALLRL
jgi:hypothetical protein